MRSDHQLSNFNIPHEKKLFAYEKTASVMKVLLPLVNKKKINSHRKSTVAYFITSAE